MTGVSMQAPLKLTEAEIEAGKSDKGGFTKETLAAWGVPWPPPSGWRKKLLRGEPVTQLDPQQKLVPSPVMPEFTAHEVLHMAVMAVVSRGQAHLFNEYPEILAYFGGQLPDRPECVIDYTNHRGERADRRIQPLRFERKDTAWHGPDQLILVAIDMDKLALRDFAVKDIHEWKEL